MIAVLRMVLDDLRDFRWSIDVRMARGKVGLMQKCRPLFWTGRHEVINGDWQGMNHFARTLACRIEMVEIDLPEDIFASLLDMHRWAV